MHPRRRGTVKRSREGEMIYSEGKPLDDEDVKLKVHKTKRGRESDLVLVYRGFKRAEIIRSLAVFPFRWIVED